MAFKVYSLVILVLAFSSNCLGDLPASERSALVDLYQATNGTGWIDNSRWLVGDPCTMGWHGVICTGNITVTSLFLNGNYLVGTIPDSISNLPNLRNLMFEGNLLRGSIPESIGSLSDMLFLFLDLNLLSGTIPSSLGNLHKMLDFRVARNQLTGTIPTELTHNKLLFSLVLRHNKLTGSILSTLGSMISLGKLDVQGNQLSGPIPNSIGNNKMLNILYLQDNQLTGTIPQSMGSLTKLLYVDLSNNKLQSPLPPFLQSKPPSTFAGFNMANNSFSCPLPTWCGPPPSGNSACAPCISSLEEFQQDQQTLCCIYSGSDDNVIKHCTTEPNCPRKHGNRLLLQQSSVNDCNQCTSSTNYNPMRLN